MDIYYAILKSEKSLLILFLLFGNWSAFVL